MLTPVALLISSAMVYQASNAAFSANTSNGSNTWAAGSLALTDNDSGSALFNVTNLVPGATGTKCIKVDYNATVTSTIKLYVNPFSDPDNMAQYLDMVVDEGAGAASSGGCSDFTKSATLLNTNLLDLSTKNSYANGLSTWAPTGNDSRTYRFTYTLNANAPDSIQGKSTSATFVWEAKTS